MLHRHLILTEKALCFLDALPQTGGKYVLCTGVKTNLMVLQSQLPLSQVDITVYRERKCEKYINRK